MSKLNAASRLREEVLNVPNTVLLISVGHPDKVIRFTRMPDSLKRWRDNKAAERSEKEFPTAHTPINLDKGPDAEAWKEITRELFLQARRDRPVPEALPVAEDCHTDWSVGPEEVPVVEINAIEVVSTVSDAPRRGRPPKEA